MTREEFFDLAKHADGIQNALAEHLKKMSGRRLRELGITSYKNGQIMLLDDVANIEKLIADSCGVTAETVQDLPAVLYTLAIDGARASFLVEMGAQIA